MTSPERKNVPILKTIHADAALAARIKDMDLQDLADEAIRERADAIIAEFKGNVIAEAKSSKRNGKRSRHARRNTTVAIVTQ